MRKPYRLKMEYAVHTWAAAEAKSAGVRRPEFLADAVARFATLPAAEQRQWGNYWYRDWRSGPDLGTVQVSLPPAANPELVGIGLNLGGRARSVALTVAVYRRVWELQNSRISASAA